MITSRSLSRICMFGILLAGASWPVATARAGLVESHGPHIEGPFSGYSTGSFTVSQFDTMGGTRTLTDVTVEVRIDSFGGKREFDNQSLTGGSIVLAIGSTVRVKGPAPAGGSQIIVIPDAVTTKATSVTATTGELPADFAGSDYAFLDGVTVSDLKSATRSSASDLSPYIGSGNVTFAWDLAGNSTTGQNVTVGGAFRTTNTTYDFTTTVHYTYVPEPTSSMSSLVVLGGLALIRRRTA